MKKTWPPEYVRCTSGQRGLPLLEAGVVTRVHEVYLRWTRFAPPWTGRDYQDRGGLPQVRGPLRLEVVLTTRVHEVPLRWMMLMSA